MLGVDVLQAHLTARHQLLIEIALTIVDATDAHIAPLERELRQLARRQTGYRALMELLSDGRADVAGHAVRAR